MVNVENVVTALTSIYNEINNEFTSSKSYYNDKLTREQLGQRLVEYLSPFGTIEVKCNESNNFLDVIAHGCIVARISWKTGNEPGFRYCDLVFGNNEDVIYIKQKYFS